MADNRTNEMPEGQVPFGAVCEALSAAAHPYDVLFFPDGELRADSLVIDDLVGYGTIVLPDCRYLSAAQASLIGRFLERKGRVVVVGAFAENLSEVERERLVGHPGLSVEDGFTVEALGDDPQVRVVRGESDLALTIRRVGDRAALHFIRYDYDEEADAVPVLDELALEVRLPFEVRSVEPLSPGGALLRATIDDGILVLRDVPLYGMIVLAP
jgi:hypothetical protein